MKAFWLAVGLMIVVALGVGYAMNDYFAQGVEQAYTSQATRLGE